MQIKIRNEYGFVLAVVPIKVGERATVEITDVGKNFENLQCTTDIILRDGAESYELSVDRIY